MLGAGGQRADGAGHFAGQVVEQHRLADIGAADDRDDQQRRQVQLRQQLAPEQIKPFLSGGRIEPHGGRSRLQCGQGAVEPLDLVGKTKVARHWGSHVGGIWGFGDWDLGIWGLRKAPALRPGRVSKGRVRGRVRGARLGALFGGRIRVARPGGVSGWARRRAANS